MAVQIDVRIGSGPFPTGSLCWYQVCTPERTERPLQYVLPLHVRPQIYDSLYSTPTPPPTMLIENYFCMKFVSGLPLVAAPLSFFVLSQLSSTSKLVG